MRRRRYHVVWHGKNTVPIFQVVLFFGHHLRRRRRKRINIATSQQRLHLRGDDQVQFRVRYNKNQSRSLCEEEKKEAKPKADFPFGTSCFELSVCLLAI